MRRAYKFRLHPNATQARCLAVSLETHRRVYNDALAARKEAYESRQETLRSPEQYPVFAERRNAQIADEKAGGSSPHWLAHISAVSLRDTIRRLDRAFDNFFRRVREGGKPGYPRFRGRDRYDSIPFDNYGASGRLVDQDGVTVHATETKNGDGAVVAVNRSEIVTAAQRMRGRLQDGAVVALVDRYNWFVYGFMTDDAPLRGYRLKVFGVGAVRIRIHRPIRGRIKTVTVKREADKWYAVFSCDLGDVTVPESTLPAAGIDVGIVRFLTTSDGRHEPNPAYLKAELPEVRRLSRKMAVQNRQKRPKRRQFPTLGGKRRRKMKKKLQRLHERIRNLRKEHHHKVALRLVRAYGFIAAESLNIKGMSGNRRLARAILDASWGGFLTTLKCKAESAGTRVVEVDAKYTSQICSRCGHCESENRLTQARFVCRKCGLALNADVNAAKNVLTRGLQQARTELAGANPHRGVAREVSNAVSNGTGTHPPSARERPGKSAAKTVGKHSTSRKQQGKSADSNDLCC